MVEITEEVKESQVQEERTLDAYGLILSLPGSTL